MAGVPDLSGNTPNGEVPPEAHIPAARFGLAGSPSQDVRTVQGVVGGTAISTTLSGTGATASEVQGNIASGIIDSGKPVKIGGKYNVTLPTFTDGQRGDVQINNKGILYNQPTIDTNGTPQGAAVTLSDTTSNIGLSVLNVRACGGVFNGTSWDRTRTIQGADGTGLGVQAVASAANTASTGKVLINKLISAASTNATVVKASAGTRYGFRASNSSASWRYLKVYNKATAPTVGTDVPIETIGIPPGGVVSELSTFGVNMNAGLSFAITALPADTDATAIVAGEVVVSIHYV